MAKSPSDTSKLLLTMENLTITREGSDVVIRFDPKKEIGLSESKKSKLIATTKGNVTVEDFVIGLNAYRKV